MANIRCAPYLSSFVTGYRLFVICHSEGGQSYGTALRPGPVSVPVSSMPSLTRNSPGNLLSHALFAAGTYSRAFPSMPETPGTWAARPAEWIKDAPGQVRSCTQRNILYFRPAAAISNAWLCPLQAFKAAPV